MKVNKTHSVEDYRCNLVDTSTGASCFHGMDKCKHCITCIIYPYTEKNAALTSLLIQVYSAKSKTTIVSKGAFLNVKSTTVPL